MNVWTWMSIDTEGVLRNCGKHSGVGHSVCFLVSSPYRVCDMMWSWTAINAVQNNLIQDHSQWQELAQDLIRCTWTNPAAQVCCELLLYLVCVCVRGAKLAFCTLLQFFWCVYLRCYGILRYVAVYMGLGGQKTFALTCIHQRRHATCRMKGIDRGW